MREVEVLVVGAGLAGLRALHSFRSAGFRTLVLEASEEIGGVWNHNRYPGARCDVESYDYSYSFSKELEQEWRWTERYPTQPEILRYINHVADRFDLRRDIELECRVNAARYDEKTAMWELEAGGGRRFRSRFLVLCLGQLSAPKLPDYPGQESFAGETIVSASWPKDRAVDFTGKRVGILGTGSSGMQMTPVVARTAAHLTVFQRTANYSVPAANAPLGDDEDRQVKANYAARRDLMRNSPTGLGFIPGKTKTLDVSAAEREEVFEKAYHRLGFGFAVTYPDILLDEKANDVATAFLKRKIGERIGDPLLREKLVPNDHRFGTRRPSVDSGYFETFSQNHVELADIRENPIVKFTPDGVTTAAKHHPLDVLIYATGFDALTGAIFKIDIQGRGGLRLKEKWKAGPVTHLGIGTSGFPNMFIVGGPGSPSVLSNVMVSIEEQVDWFVEFLSHLRETGVLEAEVSEAAEREWTAHVQERARETLYMTVDSFYNGGEIPGKARVFMPYSGGVRNYRRLLQSAAAKGYAGFELRQHPRAMEDADDR
jgi:cation diffusion facilitator CzcD-associated flavoprotein CzcO